MVEAIVPLLAASVALWTQAPPAIGGGGDQAVSAAGAHYSCILAQYAPSDPHGSDPHGPDPHSENHDPNLPANGEDPNRSPYRGDPYGGKEPADPRPGPPTPAQPW